MKAFFTGDWVEHEKYTKSFRDYAAPGKDPGQVVGSGSDAALGAYWTKMIEEGDRINRQNIGYAAGGPNNNTVVTTLLQFVGLSLPTRNGLGGPLPAPGAEMSLLRGRGSAKLGYQELIENAWDRGYRDLDHDLADVERWLFSHSHEALIDATSSLPLLARLRAMAARARADAATRPVDPPWPLDEIIMSMGDDFPFSLAPIPKSERSGRRANAASITQPGDFDEMIRQFAQTKPSYIGATEQHAAWQIAGSFWRGSLTVAAGLSRPAHIPHSGEAKSSDLFGDSDWFGPFATTYDAALMTAPGQRKDFFSAMAEPARWEMVDDSLLPSLGRDDFDLPSFAPKFRERSSVSRAPISRRVAVKQSWQAARTTYAATMPGRSSRQYAPGETPEDAALYAGVRLASTSSGQWQLEAALAALLDRQARLPPSGVTGFDPKLSPAWPGLQMA